MFNSKLYNSEDPWITKAESSSSNSGFASSNLPFANISSLQSFSTQAIIFATFWFAAATWLRNFVANSS